MTPRDEQNLREAWHGPRSLDYLATKFRMTAAAIQKFWQREKGAGRLPAKEPRPFFVPNTTFAASPIIGLPAEPDAVEADDIDDADDDDASDRFVSMELASHRGCEALLEALQRCHPNYDTALQTVEDSVTRLDAGKNIFRPSIEWLRRRARRVDQMMRQRRAA